MNDVTLRLYQHLPASFRSIAASCYGIRLRSWRYGAETDELVEQAISREQWSVDKWRQWQGERLAYVLHRAATKVPYYKSLWEARRRKGDRSSWDYLENWPVLDKQTLRDNPKAFVADDCATRKMYREHTSGTTGTPLTLWYGKKALRARNALFEARARGWHGVSRHHNWATLGGKQIVPPGVQNPPFWVWNRPMRQLYLSAGHVSRRNAKAFMDALRHYGVTHMVVYPSSASVLAAEALDLGIDVPRLSVIITVAEPLTPQRRHTLKTAFQCEVRETYGMAEIVAEASECEAGKLHIWPEIGFLEIFSDKEDLAVSVGSLGRFICTSIVNPDMPLIRYAIGDRGTQANRDAGCPCGRTLPLLSAVEGRTYELLIGRDGGLIYVSLTPLVVGLPVREAQVIQETISTVKVRYVPTIDFSKEMESVIATRLKSKLGDVTVDCEAVVNIPRESNGKFRAVICKINGQKSVVAEDTDGRKPITA